MVVLFTSEYLLRFYLLQCWEYAAMKTWEAHKKEMATEDKREWIISVTYSVIIFAILMTIII